MGYCTYGGKLVPGNNRASCIGGGGNWVAGETGPTSQLGSKPMGLPTPPVGKQFSGGPAQGYWDTDDFGTPLDYNTGPQGGTYNLFGERDRLLARSEADNFGPRKVPFGSNPIPQDPGLAERIKMHRRAQLNPPKDSMGLFGGTPTIPYTEEDAGGVRRVSEAEGKKMFADRKKQDKIQAALDARTITTKTDKGTGTGTNVFNAGGTGTPTGEEVQEIAKSGNIPKGLLDRMGTKDYWLKGMEGGSGGWDNRLFRLGEMMSYMGTPLSKRGDSPAKRWTTASAAAAKAAGTGGLTKAKRQDWRNMIANEDTLIKKFLRQKEGIFTDSAPGTEEYAAAAAKAANYIMIGNQLISEEIEPTPENIQKRADELKDKKKK